MSNGSLYSHIQNKIATVEFYHPAANSFPLELLARLAQLFNDLSNNDQVQVIVLKSENDKAFCAGASFNELLSVTNEADGKNFFMGFANVINSMRKCSKIIIGRIQGKAVGGGVGLAAACDYCFATEAASIKLSELTIGIGPFVIAPVLERKIGLAALTHLTLAAASWHNAYWAKEQGLYAKVYSSIKEMDTEIDLFAVKLASYNVEALTEMKKVFWVGTEDWDSLLESRAAISGKLVLSEKTKIALQKLKP